MTTQPANMKPNGPGEVTSLVIVKTIMEHRLDDLLEMANQADNEGRPMAGEMSYFAHEQLKEAVALVQAAIDNDRVDGATTVGEHHLPHSTVEGHIGRVGEVEQHDISLEARLDYAY